MKPQARQVAANALLGIGVFLPVFLVVSFAELLIIDDVSSTWEAMLGNATYEYLVLAPGVLAGSVLYAGLLLLLPALWKKSHKRAAAVLLASIVPGTLLTLDIYGAMLLHASPVAIALATLTLGLSVRLAGAEE